MNIFCNPCRAFLPKIAEFRGWAPMQLLVYNVSVNDFLVGILLVPNTPYIIKLTLYIVLEYFYYFSKKLIYQKYTEWLVRLLRYFWWNITQSERMYVCMYVCMCVCVCERERATIIDKSSRPSCLSILLNLFYIKLNVWLLLYSLYKSSNSFINSKNY